MSVEVTFNMNGVKEVDCFNFPNAGYARQDDNYRVTELKDSESNIGFIELEDGGKEPFIVYREDCIGRGFEVVLHETHGHASLPLPTSIEDIELFYNYIKYLCDKSGTPIFIRDEEEVSIEYIPTFIQNDAAASEGALKQIQNAIENDDYQEFFIFGVVNPICLGSKQMAEIKGDIHQFSTYMHKIQSQDIFYSGVQLFSNEEDGTTGVFVLPENCTASLPDEPFIFNREIEVDNWVIALFFDNEEVEYIPYEQLLAHVDQSNRYDAKRFIVNLSGEKMREIIENHRVLN